MNHSRSAGSVWDDVFVPNLAGKEKVWVWQLARKTNDAIAWPMKCVKWEQSITSSRRHFPVATYNSAFRVKSYGCSIIHINEISKTAMYQSDYGVMLKYYKFQKCSWRPWTENRSLGWSSLSVLSPSTRKEGEKRQRLILPLYSSSYGCILRPPHVDNFTFKNKTKLLC